MLRAINSKKEIIFSWDNPSKQEVYFCPECKEELIFVDGILVVKHFRHKVESNCDPEPETKRHVEMKLFMMENLRWKKDDLEVNLGFARPDLFQENIAVEVQHSQISSEQFLYRNFNYNKNNIYPIWIFDECLLKKNISDLMREAHKLYMGRVYVYFDNKYFKGIIPIHFSSKSRWIDSYENYSTGESYGGYEKFYKKKKNLNFGDIITDFSILKVHNDFCNLNIARFLDKKFWRSDYGKS